MDNAPGLLQEYPYAGRYLCMANGENKYLILQTSLVPSEYQGYSILCCRYAVRTPGNTGDHNIHAGKVRRSSPFLKVL